MNQKTDAALTKPGLALAIATALGAGYLPKAPGTFGSLVGVVLSCLIFVVTRPASGIYVESSKSFALSIGAAALVVSLIGVWASDRVALYLRKKDPQIVVVDEVAGQLIAYLGLATTSTVALNWQYLFAGFILFRVFDIWKPFPARRAESLPGGLGIMADDWIAGLYAALALGLARQLGW